jgi:hypothetical protein
MVFAFAGSLRPSVCNPHADIDDAALSLRPNRAWNAVTAAATPPSGSGRNIGRATVLRLPGEGAHVVVNARSNQQEAETVAREARDLGVKAVPILADVGKKG